MYTYNVTIKEIIDGDTIRVDIDLGFDSWIINESVRLAGIDAPESRTSDPDEKIFGILTKQWIIDNVLVGSTQRMQSIEFKRGKFGRVIGEFIIDNTFNLNEKLVDKHLAVVYNGIESKEDLKEQHLANRKYLIEHENFRP